MSVPFPSLETKPWWDRDHADREPDRTNLELATSVVDTVQDIERRQYSIFEGNRRHAKIYAGYLPNGLTWGTAPVSNQRVPFEATRGLVRSICDTATALIVRSRPRAAIVTDGGDWKIQRQAEDLEQFLSGAYERGGVYQVAPRCFHDSTVFGTGVWKYVSRGEGEDFHVDVERVLPDDLVVDEEECREHLQPLTMYHRVMVRADALAKQYASGKSDLDERLRIKIMAAQQKAGWPTRHVPHDRVVLVEAIYVNPDSPEDNRRVVCIPGLTLVDEKWPYDFHPYTVLWWAMPLSGFYGDGIAYRQYGRQQRITYMYRWIQRVHDLFATPRAWLPPMGGPPSLQLSNELGAVITAAREPKFQVQDSVPPEIYHWLDKLESGGFEDEGVSIQTSTNQLPPGIESAPAQREYSYKEGQRFAPVSQRWEHAVAVDTAMKMTAMYRHRAMKGKKPAVKFSNRKLQQLIEWPDLETDQYTIRAEAASLDSLSPSARTQGALELAQTGWIKPDEGRALVGHPDLRQSDELDNAPRTYAMWVLRKLYRGETVMVDEFADFQTLHDVVRDGYLLATQRGATEEDLRPMAEYLDDLDSKMQEAAQAAQQQQMGPGGGMPQSAMASGASAGPVAFDAKTP
jgi:hypothetical protein